MWSGAVNVLISGGFSSAYEQLLPEFERTSGIKVITGSGASQGTGPQTIAAQLARGVSADVAEFKPAPLLEGAALIERPKRLVYLSSGMHHHADANLDDILWKKRRWNGSTAYAESKLHDAILAFAIARRWPDVFSNALEPGRVPTKMGGSGAPDDMDQAHLTQAWLAAGDDTKADVTGQYFYHLKRMEPNLQSHDVLCRTVSS